MLKERSQIKNTKDSMIPFIKYPGNGKTDSESAYPMSQKFYS